MSILEVKDLHANIHNHEILKGLNLTVKAGEMHSIMGPNGSGKSTLAQVLARREAYEVTRGQVLLNGKDLLAMKPEEGFAHCNQPIEYSNRKRSPPDKSSAL